MIVRLIKRIFCDHDYGFVRNIYDDPSSCSGKKRRMLVCGKCGKVKIVRDGTDREKWYKYL